MTRYAVIDSDGNVTNVVLWAGEGDWQPPQGAAAVLLDGDDPVPPVAERKRGKPARALPDAALARLPAHVSPGGRVEGGEYAPPSDTDSQ